MTNVYKYAFKQRRALMDAEKERLEPERLSVNAPNLTDDNQGKKKFNGVAHSGLPYVNRWGEKSIIDLNGIKFAKKVPVLQEHNPDMRIGFAELKVENNQLLIDGVFLSNEYAERIYQDGKDGFPFELSIYSEPLSVEYLSTGGIDLINGAQYEGEIRIIRQSQIREVSFTPIGVDKNTHANLLSQSNQNPEGAVKMDKTQIEKLSARNAELEALQKELLSANKTLQEENEQLKNKMAQSELNEQLSQAGFKRNEKGEWDLSPNVLSALLRANKEERADLLSAIKPASKGLPSHFEQRTIPAEQNPNEQLSALDKATKELNENKGGNYV